MADGYVALLRGVNLGGQRRMAMADLKEMVEGVGFGQVRTYIQSGNVVFRAGDVGASAAGAAGRREEAMASKLEDAIRRRWSIETDVMVRSATQMHRIVESNPFPGADTRQLHVAFLKKAPTARAVAGLKLDELLPEEAVVKKAEAYLNLPSGMARTKMPASLGRQLGVPMTIRNWNTTVKLAELA